MVDFLTRFDNTDREPRYVQQEALRWLEMGWNKSRIHAIMGPTGCGKSAIARAIQVETGAHIVTPANILIDQYCSTYPDVNFLKGKRHYKCDMGGTCYDWVNILGGKPCSNCPYVGARARALRGAATFFNPMSLYYLSMAPEYARPKVMVVDEAHQLLSMVMLLCGKRFSHSTYKFTDECRNELYLIKWMKTQLDKLHKLSKQYQKTDQKKKLVEITEEIERISLTLFTLQEEPENYVIWISEEKFRGRMERFLNVKPIRPPRVLLNRILDADKIVLMSGTLLPTDLAELVGGEPFRLLDLKSPIPKEQREIIYKPMPFKVNYKTDPTDIVAAIEQVVKWNPNENTIIHVTYSMSKKLAPKFTVPIIYNTPENKDEKLEQFKKEGGVFLAAGCAEGLDLYDDLCRINIIPKMSFLDLGDPTVKKRKALEDGDKWYSMEALKTVIQQAGRSTRSATDRSKIFVLDPMFARLVNKYRRQLPRSFVESIVWKRT